ncbi:S-adenosyl-L-methionine-dependent methyltransferase [Hypoxylon cercidicola]|nr:S-adenosyl-L-methionine-dependent methyltransferase [Hypoxylon cercidicola]
MEQPGKNAAYLLKRLEALQQSNPKSALLDVGAGSGTISITLAKAIPEGRVIASDVKQDIPTRAQAIAESEGVKNIEFQQAGAYKLPFADGTFHVTHCHQVLCHLKASSDTLREMLRVTKPGGLVAVREGDLESDCT